MDPNNPAWLSPPYYTPEPAVYVDIPWFGRQPTAETMMGVLTRQLLSWPQGFVWGASGSGADTPGQLQNDIVAYAKSLTESPIANLTAPGFDYTARGIHYFNIVQETLKQIPASSFDWTQGPGTSVYDVWTKPKA